MPFEYMTLAIRNFYDSGSFSLCPPRWQSSPRCSTGSDITSQPPRSVGFAANPLTLIGYPEISSAITHLREVLGDGDLRIIRPHRRQP